MILHQIKAFILNLLFTELKIYICVLSGGSLGDTQNRKTAQKNLEKPRRKKTCKTAKPQNRKPWETGKPQNSINLSWKPKNRVYYHKINLDLPGMYYGDTYLLDHPVAEPRSLTLCSLSISRLKWKTHSRATIVAFRPQRVKHRVPTPPTVLRRSK